MPSILNVHQRPQSLSNQISVLGGLSSPKKDFDRNVDGCRKEGRKKCNVVLQPRNLNFRCVRYHR